MLRRSPVRSTGKTRRMDRWTNFCFAFHRQGFVSFLMCLTLCAFLHRPGSVKHPLILFKLYKSSNVSGCLPHTSYLAFFGNSTIFRTKFGLYDVHHTDIHHTRHPPHRHPPHQISITPDVHHTRHPPQQTSITSRISTTPGRKF